MVENPGAENKASRRVKLSDHVILDINGEFQVQTVVNEKSTLRLKRELCSVDALVGSLYGSLFELSSGTQGLEKRRRICETAGEDWQQVLEIDRDNSKLQDSGVLNQSLTAADIAQLKAEGKSGDEIITALTSNSATFRNKTQYSQEKYKKKKAKKYLTKVTVIRPTAKTIADFYFSKCPLKTAHLRSDSLALLLNLANIGAGCRALTVDAVQGLVTGAVMERMGGIGSVVNSFAGTRQPPNEIIRMFNFPEAFHRTLGAGSLRHLRDLAGECLPAELPTSAEGLTEANDVKQAPEAPDSAAHNAKESHNKRSRIEEQQVETAASRISLPTQEPGQSVAAALSTTPIQPNLMSEAQDAAASLVAIQTDQTRQHGMLNSIELHAEPHQELENGLDAAQATDRLSGRERGGLQDPEAAAAWAKKKERREMMEQMVAEACQQGFQSCIIASPAVSPSAMLQAILPLLAPSASFAIFFPSAEPLAECKQMLQQSKAAVALELQESWLREYQVLPGRTHPQMAASGTGGYILSGIKVLP